MSDRDVLRGNEAELDLLEQDGDLGFFELEIATGALSLTSGLLALAEIPSASEIPPWEELLARVAPEDQPALLRALQAALESGGGTRAEFRVRVPSGGERALRADIVAHRDAAGAPVRFAGLVRDVSELRRALADLSRERTLAELGYAVATAANEARTLEEAARRVLALVCERLSFDLGRAYFLPKKGAGAPLDVPPEGYWHDTDPVRFAPFRAATEAIAWEPGVGVLGRVLRDGEIFWTADLGAEQGALRAEAAAAAGVQAMLAVPVWIDREVVGALELFDARAPAMDARLLRALASVGVQLGRVVERVRAEAALRADRTTLGQFLDGIPLGVFVADAEGKPFYVNRYCREHVFEHVGKPITDALLSAQPALARTFVAGTDRLYPTERLPGIRALSGETSSIDDLEIRGPTRTIPLQAWGTPIFDAEGRVRLSLVTFMDVSGRRHLEQMKDELISVVSHELRTPLTAIRGALGLLLGSVVGEVGGEARELLHIAGQNCERLTRLVDDLLDLQKIESNVTVLHMVPVRIGSLIERAADEVRPYAEGIGVRVERVDRLEGAVVTGDPDRLLQVLANLVSNAAKFSPPGETITIVGGRRDERVRVEVRDRGPGVAPSFRPRLFQKFSQAETSDGRRRGGTGLGLSICKSIIDKLGGSIGHEPHPGGGAIFYFELPAEP